jgi:hypothetical protein
MLISEKQHAANCRNASRSTGPVTIEGKAAVRLNALRYGLRARSILLPGENSDELQQLFENLEDEWRPQNRTEQLFVEQMAVAQWKLARLEVGERSILMQEMPAERQMALLDRFSSQRSRLERSFSKAMSELQHLRKTSELAIVPEKTAGRRPTAASHNAGSVESSGVTRYLMAPDLPPAA